MKFNINKNEFSEGLNIVLKAVPGKTTMPVLECVVIEALEDCIKLTTNDMQLGIETKVYAEIERQGNILVNAKMLSDIIKCLPDKEIDFEVDENNQILIFCGKSKFNIPGISNEEFPMLPQIEIEKNLTLAQSVLRDMIQQTIFSISNNESQKVLTGELFEINGNEFRITSLDNIRVSIRKYILPEEYENIKAIIPGKALMEISKIITGGDEDEVEISFSKNHVLFRFDRTIVISRLLEGNFFNVNQLLKNNYETKVEINKDEFFGCINRAALLIRESDKKPVKLNIFQDGINIEITTNIGSMDEEVSANMEGNEMHIALDPKYVSDVLKVVDDENIDIYLLNSNSPCIIKNDDETYIYIILPVNL